MSTTVRVLSALIHLPAWVLIIGGFSGGIALIMGAIALPSVVVGVFGALLIGVTAGLCVTIRDWLSF